ncbi:MAG TPA: type II CAAX endopeptidase family protein [Methylomirabilota bacterium]
MRPVWTALLVYVVAVVAVLGLQLAAVTVLVGWGGAIETEGDALATLLAGVPASSLALIAIAVLAGGRPASATLRLRRGRIAGAGLAVVVAGALALSQALESLTMLLGVGPGPALDWIARTMAAAPPIGVLLAVVVVGVLAPIGEELFFRGYLQTRLRQVWRPGPAILVTALAFGVIHGEPVHGVLAFLLGLYLGLVTERAASVVPAVVCHAANNSVSVVLSAWVGSPESFPVNAVIFLVTAPVVAGAIWWMSRLSSARSA